MRDIKESDITSGLLLKLASLGGFQEIIKD